MRLFTNEGAMRKVLIIRACKICKISKLWKESKITSKFVKINI